MSSMQNESNSDTNSKRTMMKGNGRMKITYGTSDECIGGETDEAG